MFIDILIYLIVAILLAFIIARLNHPLNLIIAAVIVLFIAVTAFKLFGASLFAFGLFIWMAFIIGGLYVLRNLVRSGRI